MKSQGIIVKFNPLNGGIGGILSVNHESVQFVRYECKYEIIRVGDVVKYDQVRSFNGQPDALNVEFVKNPDLSILDKVYQSQEIILCRVSKITPTGAIIEYNKINIFLPSFEIGDSKIELDTNVQVYLKQFSYFGPLIASKEAKRNLDTVTQFEKYIGKDNYFEFEIVEINDSGIVANQEEHFGFVPNNHIAPLNKETLETCFKLRVAVINCNATSGLYLSVRNVMLSNELSELYTSYKRLEQQTGVVKNILNKGFMVDFKGLELFLNKNYAKNSNLQINDSVVFKVIDYSRINYISISTIETTPAAILTQYNNQNLFQCTVNEVHQNGITLSINEDYQGYMTFSEVSEDWQSLVARIKVGWKINASIFKFDGDGILLSRVKYKRKLRRSIAHKRFQIGDSLELKIKDKFATFGLIVANEDIKGIVPINFFLPDSIREQINIFEFLTYSKKIFKKNLIIKCKISSIDVISNKTEFNLDFSSMDNQNRFEEIINFFEDDKQNLKDDLIKYYSKLKVKQIKIIKRPGTKTIEPPKPVFIIGILEFFDYRTNHFGIVNKINKGSAWEDFKVYVPANGLDYDKELDKSELVIFNMIKDNRGFSARNLKPLKNADLPTIITFFDQLSYPQITSILGAQLKSNFDLLPDNQKSIVASRLIESSSISSWRQLNSYDLKNYYDEFITLNIKGKSDIEKLAYLRCLPEEGLINHVLSDWVTTDSKIINQLLDAISTVSLNEIQNIRLCEIILSSGLNFWELKRIVNKYKLEFLNDRLIDYYSFAKDPHSLRDLKEILPFDKLNEKKIFKLKDLFNSQSDNISSHQLIEQFQDLKNFRVLDHENQLLLVLEQKGLKHEDLSPLISLLTNQSNLVLFAEIVKFNLKEIPTYAIKQIFQEFNNKPKILLAFIDGYLSNDSIVTDSSVKNLLAIIISDENEHLVKLFLDKYHNVFAKLDADKLLAIGINRNHIESIGSAIRNLTFNSENDIINFSELVYEHNLNGIAAQVNQPLASFIDLLRSTENFFLTIPVKEFLKTHQGIIQTHTVKFLIYQYHKERLTFDSLLTILDSFQWTEISAILIRHFIVATDHSDKILLERLSGIFKAHFDILVANNFDPQEFANNFTIRNILNKCDGRKKHNARFDSKSKKWYLSDNQSLSIESYMDCYCEGRPWKTESFYNTATQLPTQEKYSFYWCRNKYCAERNDTVDFQKPYKDWALSEIAAVMGFTIEKNALALLSGWANRMNEIVGHLFCRKCNQVLRPLPYNPVVLGYYAVPIFNCINPGCNEYQHPIRFTHCLNRKCESHKTSSPLDSRDCESCKPSDPGHTGLKCNFCGQGCPVCSGKANYIITQDTW